jgi:hypothetical protein
VHRIAQTTVEGRMLSTMILLAATSSGGSPPSPTVDIIAGSAFVALGTGVDVALAKKWDMPNWGLHFVPLVGPVLSVVELARRPCSGQHSGECGFAHGYLYFQTAVNFAAAATGTFFLVRGLVNASSSDRAATASASTGLSPWVEPGVAGVRLGGTF